MNKNTVDVTPPTLADLYLVSGNIVFFSGPHSPLFKQDLLHSSLISDLVTRKNTPAPKVFWPAYTDMLGKMHWIVNHRETFHADFGTSSLVSIIERNTASVLSTEDLRAFRLAVSQLDLPSESPACRAFEKRLCSNAYSATKAEECSSTSAGSVQTAALLTFVRKDKTILTIEVSFETSSTKGFEILDQPLLKIVENEKINIRMFISTMDEQKYAAIRDTITTKLGNKIGTELIHMSHR